MVTDPPYGVDYDPAWRHRAGVNNSERLDRQSPQRRASRLGSCLGPVSGQHRLCLAWRPPCDDSRRKLCPPWLHYSRANRLGQGTASLGRGDYHWQHEPCWYAVRTKGYWTGDRKQTTLWNIASCSQDTEQPMAHRSRSNACDGQSITTASRPGGLRPIPRQRNDPDRCPDHRPSLSGDGN